MQYKTSQKSKVIVRGRFNDAKNTHIKNIGPHYFWSRNSIPIITQDVTKWFSDLLVLGTIHLRRRQIFKIFDPYQKKPHADVLNGWSLGPKA